MHQEYLMDVHLKLVSSVINTSSLLLVYFLFAEIIRRAVQMNEVEQVTLLPTPGGRATVHTNSIADRRLQLFKSL